MTEPASEEHQPPPRPGPMHGRRTRLAVAIMGCLLSLGVPIVALSSPTLAVDEQTVPRSEDPVGLSTTGALPGAPLPAGPAPPTAQGLPVSDLPSPTPGESPSIDVPGIPTPPDLPDGPLGIPGVMLDAYQFAQRTLADVRPGCHLPWTVLAGIGRIESNHADGGRVDAFGNTLGRILGPQLDGSPGVAAIPDTDHGTLDGDTVWDRAVGPMQFLPSTWRQWGVDGNGDGVADPNNIYDATVTAGLYLCAGGADLSDPTQLRAAVFRYNHSTTYVDVVLRWAQAYLTGVVPTPSAPGPVPPGTTGNGGRVITPESVLPATPSPAAVAQVAPITPSPSPTSSSSPPSARATPTAPVAASPSPTATTTSEITPQPGESPSPTPPLTGTATPLSSPSTSTPPLPSPTTPSPTTSLPTTPPPTTTALVAPSPTTSSSETSSPTTSSPTRPSPTVPLPTTPLPTTTPSPRSAGS